MSLIQIESFILHLEQLEHYAKLQGFTIKNYTMTHGLLKGIFFKARTDQGAILALYNYLQQNRIILNDVNDLIYHSDASNENEFAELIGEWVGDNMISFDRMEYGN